MSTDWFVGGVLIVLFACIVVSYEAGRAYGSLPLTQLKPGREYRVEAVLPDQLGFRRDRTARLVLSWHVDYGHYEFKLANLERSRLNDSPRIGDLIVGRRMEYGGGMCYDVYTTLPKAPVADACA